jgi:hypothetical protein
LEDLVTELMCGRIHRQAAQADVDQFHTRSVREVVDEVSLRHRSWTFSGALLIKCSEQTRVPVVKPIIHWFI